jgi:hypothetical protein
MKARRAGAYGEGGSVIRRRQAPWRRLIMMKNLLVLACTLAIGTAAFAAPAKSPTKAHFTGTIGSYDATGKTLTVKHDGKDTTFVLGDQALIMKGAQKADASSLAASTGQSVKVEYVMNGASRVADKVEVAAVHAAHASAPKKK